MKFSAVILAGGQSRRMGHDKAWLPVQGKPLIARQVDLVRELGAMEIFISGRAEVDYSGLNVPVLKDHFEDAGPLAGVERALAEISTTLLLVLAVDMPKIELLPLRTLIDRSSENCGGISRVNNRIEPLAAVYPRTSSNLVKELLKNRRYAMRHFAEGCVESGLAAYVDFSEEHSGYFENWNSPADVSG